MLAGSGVVASIAGLTLVNQVKALTPGEISQIDAGTVNAFDRGATKNYSARNDQARTVIALGCIASPALFLTGKAPRHDGWVIGMMYAEALMFSASLPYIAKGCFRRTRPFVYNPAAPMQEKLKADAAQSFFSLHATMAFSSAVFLSTVYSAYYPSSKWRPVVWGGSMLAAGAVGYLSYSSGAHFPTDILAGAVVGSAIGFLVPWLHRSTKKQDFSLLPVYSGQSSCIAFLYHF